MEGLRPKLKQASLLWLDGLLDACCLHRVVIYCLRFLLSPHPRIYIYMRTHILVYVVMGTYVETTCDPNRAVLSLERPDFPRKLIFWLNSLGADSNLATRGIGIVVLSDVCIQLYSKHHVVSSCVEGAMWEWDKRKMEAEGQRLARYNDIAKFGFLVIGKQGPTPTEMPGQQELSSSSNATQLDKRIDLGGAMIGIAEQVYSVILLNIFFLEVYVTGLIPYMGKPLNFLLISWMYAYYCFEYKWNFSGLSLGKRLYFFESNWAFFAGFGKFSFSPEEPLCSAFILFHSSCELRDHGYTLSTVFILFVLTAAGSDADELIISQRRKWKGAGLGRLPIFCAADYMS
ncbi:hypothetical protein C3L33_21246, partial [Rhododendron williamsianum]